MDRTSGKRKRGVALLRKIDLQKIDRNLRCRQRLLAAAERRRAEAEQASIGRAIEAAGVRFGDAPEPRTPEAQRALDECGLRQQDLLERWAIETYHGTTLLSYGAWVRRMLGVPPSGPDLDELSRERTHQRNLLARRPEAPDALLHAFVTNVVRRRPPHRRAQREARRPSRARAVAVRAVHVESDVGSGPDGPPPGSAEEPPSSDGAAAPGGAP